MPVPVRTRVARLAALALFAALSASCSGATPPTADEPWRTSWSAFATAVDNFRRAAWRANPEAPEFPQAGRDMLAKGEVTPANWPVMKAFHGRVTFEGKFEAVETNPDDLMPGQSQKLKFEIPFSGVPGFAVLHLYPSPTSVTRWRAIAPGSNVRFSGNLRGISAMGINDKYLYFVLLTNAEPIKVTVAATQVPSQPN